MRRKKRTKIIAIMVMVITIGGITMYCGIDKSGMINVYTTKTFELADYKWEIENFASNKNIGEIKEEKNVIDKVKILWNKEFNINSRQTKNIEISFDSQEECWHINNVVSRNTLGGVVHAIIRKNGDVVAIWYED